MTVWALKPTGKPDSYKLTGALRVLTRCNLGSYWWQSKTFHAKLFLETRFINRLRMAQTWWRRPMIPFVKTCGNYRDTCTAVTSCPEVDNGSGTVRRNYLAAANVAEFVSHF